MRLVHVTNIHILVIHTLFLAYRENLTLSAHMKLPSSMPWKEIFERVEQVIEIVSYLLETDIMM